MGQPTSEGSTAFRGDPGGAGTPTGTLVLVEAYAAIWLVVFGLLWWTLRRQRRLAARLEELERRLEGVGAARGDGGAQRSAGDVDGA